MSYPNSPTKAFFPLPHNHQPHQPSHPSSAWFAIFRYLISVFVGPFLFRLSCARYTSFLFKLKFIQCSSLIYVIPMVSRVVHGFRCRHPHSIFFIPFRDTFLFGTIIFSDASNGGSAHIAPSLPHPTVLTEPFRAVFPIMTFMQAGIVVLPDDVWL